MEIVSSGVEEVYLKCLLLVASDAGKGRNVLSNVVAAQAKYRVLFEIQVSNKVLTVSEF